MDSYNEIGEYHCMYCNKKYHTRNALKQHEARCKSNPNRVISKHPKRGKYNTSGVKWMTDGITTKMINPREFDNYIKMGWKFGLSEEYRKKLSIGLIGKSTGKAKDLKSEELRKQKISASMKGNRNWEKNKKRGNSKQGRYKGIECDSTWELAFLVYHIENNLNIKRSTRRLSYIFEGNKHIYTPDFETDFGIIEIKGRKDKKAIVKQQIFPEIKVIDKYEIKPYLKYVNDKYGKEFWKILYDRPTNPDG